MAKRLYVAIVVIDKGAVAAGGDGTPVVVTRMPYKEKGEHPWT